MVISTIKWNLIVAKTIFISFLQLPKLTKCMYCGVVLMELFTQYNLKFEDLNFYYYLGIRHMYCLSH